MSSYSRPKFSSRRILPTISESPTTSTGGNAVNAPGVSRAKTANVIPKLKSTRQPTLNQGLKVGLVKARTSKTSQKHVTLPTEAQEAPLPSSLESPERQRVQDEDSDNDGVWHPKSYHARGGLSDEELNISLREARKRSRMGGEREGKEWNWEDSIWKRTLGEQLSVEQRDEMGYQRLTAYYCCEMLDFAVLSAFLKREHAVSPRLYDDAIYALYHLPLLPGYQPNVKVRSTTTDKSAHAKLVLSLITEAEESGYRDAYFPTVSTLPASSGSSTPIKRDRDLEGYIETAFPSTTNFPHLLASKALSKSHSHHHYQTSQPEAHSDSELPRHNSSETTPLLGSNQSQQLEPSLPPVAPLRIRKRLPRAHIAQRRLLGVDDKPVAEIIFFRYGVVVFFGFTQRDELNILDDLVTQEILVNERKKGEKKDYEIESFHFEYDPSADTPRIYNDFFTFKSPSHLLKLAIAHAIAQSTVLAVHESASSDLLSSPTTLSIPLQLASSGVIKMRRRVALRLTGQLFKLRQNVNLSSNVLDIPELFWSEASLKGLYDAVREYLEVDQRVKALNEKLASVGDLLDVIHDHLNGDAMERITMIIIWLIVVACLVELGELLARWVLAASASSKFEAAVLANRQAVLKILEESGVKV